MKILLMYPPSRDHLVALETAAQGVTLVVAQGEAAAAQEIVDTEAVLGNRYLLQSLPRAANLRWVQSTSVGVDKILAGAGERMKGVILTCTRGVYDDEMAEHALALLLGVARGLHFARDAQRARRWGRWTLPPLAGRSCLVLGWGGVGKGIARRLLAMGVTVEGARRTHTGPPVTDEMGCIVHGPETWRQALLRSEILVVALPMTRETRQIVGQAELESLPAGAILVNVGRGGTVDETALLAALRSGRLQGAGIDALAKEPPLENHPLWAEERLLLTPHVARSLERPPHRWESLFVENLSRYATGRPLLNIVDQEAGY